jgi:hypothetical protein
MDALRKLLKPAIEAHRRLMILLDYVVEVFAAPHQHVLPLWILPAQKAQRSMAGCVATAGFVIRAFRKKA